MTNETKKHNAIICAANRNPKTGQIIKGHRHFDSYMQHKFKFYALESLEFTDQGFIDMYNNFVSREEALKIAKDNGQYLNLKGLGNPDSDELYSEALYE